MCEQSQAQIPKGITYGIIDSLRLMPSEPTINDDIQIIAYTSFGYSDCTLDSIVRVGSMSTADTALIVTVYHSVINAVIQDCSSIDTVNIGKWEEGAYTLSYALQAPYF